ncbi:DUF4189 domain-containing protein [Pseudomonas sp. CGJS7]|uniref:DUF4189 domain-containing protein n=1 Tax=Pseudomonas sp. CGJS7 TaxID=3109348 RepID=UPI003FA70E1F
MRTLCIFLLFGVTGACLGQGCPAGIPSAGNPACIPPDRSNSPYYRGSQGAASTPSGRWETRWGAFAIDLKVGLGASSGMRSERAAKSAAMTQCRNKGGVSCKVELVYFNQCGVIVAGASTFSTSAAPTIDGATAIGMNSCRKAGDRDCYVYFSECSPAEFEE